MFLVLLGERSTLLLGAGADRISTSFCWIFENRYGEAKTESVFPYLTVLSWHSLGSSQRKASIKKLPRSNWPVGIAVETVLTVNWSSRTQHTGSTTPRQEVLGCIKGLAECDVSARTEKTRQAAPYILHACQRPGLPSLSEFLLV